MHKAWHYVGAVLVVVVGIWVAQMIPNPLSGVGAPKAGG
jgi:hypothetical protein